eukprot:GHRR01035507.1.p1 GENE.GHRR01035507.1~~GHRR01035507.1.p1  ORF type:complete len:213 (-),score=27.19 GHRR01035507.1:1175-1813(-)
MMTELQLDTMLDAAAAATTLHANAGPFPVWLKDCFPKLEELDLSCNRLTGTIPDYITTMPILTEVKLEDNQLIGTISPEFGRMKLRRFQVEINHMVGPIPETFRQVTAANGQAWPEAALCTHSDICSQFYTATNQQLLQTMAMAHCCSLSSVRCPWCSVTPLFSCKHGAFACSRTQFNRAYLASTQHSLIMHDVPRLLQEYHTIPHPASFGR